MPHRTLTAVARGIRVPPEPAGGEALLQLLGLPVEQDDVGDV